PKNLVSRRSRQRPSGRRPAVFVRAALPERAGTLRECFIRSEGGTVKAARLPKGWTGPSSTSGDPGSGKPLPGFFCAHTKPADGRPRACLPLRVDEVD